MSDSKPDGDQEDQEFDKLLSQLLDHGLDEQQSKLLEEMLESSPERQQKLLQYTHLNAQLMWRFRSGEIATQETVDDDLDSPAIVPDLNESRSNRPRRTSRLVFATLSLGLLVFLALHFSQPKPDPSEFANFAPIPSTAFPAEFVATLRDASGILFHENNSALNVGDRIKPGTIKLDSGDVELVFDSGARVILSGPAEMDLSSSLMVNLNYGTLVAHMPPSAIGFEVRTETAEFIDQGTEFGLTVDRNGASEVHVFRGQVDVHPNFSGKKKSQPEPKFEIVEREAFRVESSEDAGRNIDFSKARFGTLASKISEPVEWRLDQGGNGHFYQLVVTEHPITWHEANLRAMHRYHRGLHGHLTTITSAPENEFLINTVLKDTRKQGAWIGLTDTLVENHYQWITGEPLEFTHWSQFPVQQPDNFIEADWHGGEDFGMFSKLQKDIEWAWNDLSNDSMHEKVTAYIVEYEPPVDSLKNQSIASPPIVWSKENGGNGHTYRLVLSFAPESWEEIRQKAQETEFQGQAGHLVVLDSESEREFVTHDILRICGIPQVAIGLSKKHDDIPRWINGKAVEQRDLSESRIPNRNLFGFLNWTTLPDAAPGWRVQFRDMPAKWFGYLIEYETPSDPSEN